MQEIFCPTKKKARRKNKLILQARCPKDRIKKRKEKEKKRRQEEEKRRGEEENWRRREEEKRKT